MVSRSGRLTAIDHGLTFLSGSRGEFESIRQSTSAAWWWQEGLKLTAEEQAAWIARLTNPELARMVERAGFSPAAVAAFRKRLDEVLRAVRSNTLRDIAGRVRTY